MAVYSMTGYASAHQGGPAAATAGQAGAEAGPGIGVELRSVNSRFLDVVFKLPDDLRAAEPALRERVALLKGLPVTVVDEVIARRITLTSGGPELIATMKARGHWCGCCRKAASRRWGMVP